jgi:THO complex subunit 4
LGSVFFFKYDRSGRSSGIAIVSYETSLQATKAKNQFDGALAKGMPVFYFSFDLYYTAYVPLLLGQPMSIAYDISRPRRAANASSLLDRVQKPPLMNRLSKSGDGKKTPSGPWVASAQDAIYQN